MNKKQKNNNNIYKKLLISKVILDLIKNYKAIDEYNRNSIEDEKIEKENIEIIKKNLSWLEQLNLNFDEKYIKSKNIDEIYIEIIQSLIFQKKFEDYEFSHNIFTQLELKSIDITGKIFYNIKTILESKNNNCIGNYLISKESDIFDIKKINFYYILIYFILKNSIFIYKINFLLKTRKFLVKLINDKSDIFSSSNIKNIDRNSKERLDYILEHLLDSNYYIQKYINLKHDESNFSDIIEPEVVDDEELDEEIINESSIFEESIKEENNNEKNNNEENNIEESSDDGNTIRHLNNSSYKDSNKVSKISISNIQYNEQIKSNNEKSIFNYINLN